VVRWSVCFQLFACLNYARNTSPPLPWIIESAFYFCTSVWHVARYLWLCVLSSHCDVWHSTDLATIRTHRNAWQLQSSFARTLRSVWRGTLLSAWLRHLLWLCLTYGTAHARVCTYLATYFTWPAPGLFTSLRGDTIQFHASPLIIRSGVPASRSQNLSAPRFPSIPHQGMIIVRSCMLADVFQQHRSSKTSCFLQYVSSRCVEMIPIPVLLATESAMAFQEELLVTEVK
jgi:hypothetical protein